MLRVLVWGAGSIGLYVSIRLRQAGHDVAIRARGAITEGVDRLPLSLCHGTGVEKVSGVEILSSLDGRRFDVIVVATKAWQIEEVALDIADALAPDGRVVTMQNGVDAPAVLAERVTVGQVVAGSVVVVVSRTGPREVELLGNEAKLTLGYPDGATMDAQPRRVLDLLGSASIDVQWSSDIRSVLWRKLALIAAYGGVGALSGATVGETRAIPQTAALVEQAMREVIAVANAQGAVLGEDDLREIVESYRTGFPSGTRTSLQRDLVAGRPSELFDLHGAIVDHGARVGVPTPINWSIFASQLPRERAARGDTASAW